MNDNHRTSPMTVPPDVVGQFVDAAVHNPALADSLLKQHPDLRSAKWVGDSILRFLAIENFPDGVRFLAERGWSVEERDEFGNTPLFDAVRAGAHNALCALIALGADPNAVSATDDNALHCAIAAGNSPMVRTLLDAGANPNYKTESGETAFDVIPNKADKNREIRAILREHGLDAPDA